MAMYPNATHGYMPFVKPAHKRQAARRSKADKDSVKSRTAEGTKTYKVTMRDRRGFTYTYIIQADASKNLPVLCESRVTAPDGAPSPTTSTGTANTTTTSASTLPAPLLSNSLPNMRSSVRFPLAPPETRSCASLADGKEDLTKVGDGGKKGLFNSLLQFIKKKTTSSSSASSSSSSARTGASRSTATAAGKIPATKVKRKLKPLPQRKRPRTVSALTHLGTIHESPDEDNLFGDADHLGGGDTDPLGVGDTDSYTETQDSVTCSSGGSSSSNSNSESESGEGQESCPCP